MDFFKLCKKEDYIVTGQGKYREDIWPDSRYIILEYVDKYEIAISYTDKTFFVHRVIITIYGKDRYRDGNRKTDLEFMWFAPGSEESFKKVTDHDYHYMYGHKDKPMRIEDEEEMDYMILKLKYT